MKGLDRQKAGIFALRPRVRLHRHGVIPGDLAQPVRQIANRLSIAFGLIGRTERVKRPKLGPGDRHHLGRGVQFHRAGAQRDHGAVKREVSIRKATHIAHHLGLCPVHVKNRVGQIIRLARHLFRETQRRAMGRGNVDAKGPEHAVQDIIIRCLVEADAHPIGADLAEVQPFGPSGRKDAGLTDANLNRDRVEEGLGRHLRARRSQRFGQAHSAVVDAFGD